MAAKLIFISVALLPLYLLLLYLISRKKSGIVYALKAFALGIISTVPLVLVHEFHLIEVSRLHFTVGIFLTTLLFAGIEEICKKVAEHFHRRIHKKEEENVPFVKWVSVGLGFAYLENVFYIASALDGGDIVTVTILRLFFGTLAHTSFTSFGGVLSFGVSRSLLYELRGFAGASISHTVFNLLHHYHLSFLTIPVLALVLVFFYVLHKKHLRVLASRGDPPREPPG
jgi:RsiW-degrading membrane proteinase PrsW (M82 family)